MYVYVELCKNVQYRKDRANVLIKTVINLVTR